MTRPLFGIALPPNSDHLSLLRRVIEDEADLFEVSPETLWDSSLQPTDAHAFIREIVRRSGKPVVAHGLALSPGSPGDDERVGAHLEAVARDQRDFGFLWYSEHLGFTQSHGIVSALPLPLPHDAETIATLAANMMRLAIVVPRVALENQAALIALGDPAKEPEFLNATCEAAGCDLLLDLHNAFVNCANFELSYDDWLDALDLVHVLEIHVSGGSVSEPSLLRSGRTFRMDSHDGAVPAEVWRALERLLPRCPNLRAVVIERNEGTLDDDNVGAFEAEVARLRGLLC